MFPQSSPLQFVEKELTCALDVPSVKFVNKKRMDTALSEFTSLDQLITMTQDDPLLIGICEMNPAAEYASNRFRWINNAYEILSKEETRRFWHRYVQRQENPDKYGYHRKRVAPKAKTRPKAKAAPEAEAGVSRTTPAEAEKSKTTPAEAEAELPGSPVSGDDDEVEPSEGDSENSDVVPECPDGPEWDDFCRHHRLDPGHDIHPFLDMVHPCEGGNEKIILGLAFAMVKKGQSVRIPFNPLPPQDNPHAPTSWLRAIPEEWAVEDGVQYLRCTKLYNLPSIMEHGLKCGPRGYGAGCPPNHRHLYTFKNRKAALACYAEKQCLRIQIPDLPGAFIDKYFIVWIGVGMARAWDRPKKIARKSKRHQFAFRKKTFIPLWVEYVPVEGANELIPDYKPTDMSVKAGRGEDKRHMKRWRQKEERAYTLIYEVDDDLVPQEKAAKPIESTPNWWKESQKVEKKSNTKRGWDKIDWEEDCEWDDDWKGKDSKKKTSRNKKHSSESKSSKDKDWQTDNWKSSEAKSSKDKKDQGRRVDEWKSAGASSSKNQDWKSSDWKSETWQEQQSDWTKHWKRTGEPSSSSSSQPWAKEEKEQLRDEKYKKMKDVLSKEGEPFQSEEEKLPPWRTTKPTVDPDSSWSSGNAWSRTKDKIVDRWSSLYSTN